MDSETPIHTSQLGKPVSSGELNSWRRGFTPQAEIWNGRMAMFGLGIGLVILIFANIIFGN